MCIVAIAHQVSTRYPLIVAANRDERHARASTEAHWWAGPGLLLAGQDLEAGGTWLGVTKSGRFAAVTNIFEADAAPGERSRGELVTAFLRGSVNACDHAAAVADEGSRFGPFNLVFSDGDELAFVSNRNAAETLRAGIHVFSNNVPGLQWTKVGLLAEVIEGSADRDDLHEYLMEKLSGPAARGPLERAPDSLFVVGERFGTRCTTVLTVDAAGHARFIEQRFAASGADAGRSAFNFDIAR